MHDEKGEVQESQQVQVERCHEQKHDCVQVFVESKPNAFIRERAPALDSRSG